MSVLILMIPFSLLLGIGFVGSFLWAASKGQFDDVETPSMRILFDDENKHEHRSLNGTIDSSDSKERNKKI